MFINHKTEENKTKWKDHVNRMAENRLPDNLASQAKMYTKYLNMKTKLQHNCFEWDDGGKIGIQINNSN